MKRFLLTQDDLDKLTLMVDRNPKHGARGGGSDSSVDDPVKRAAYEAAHRFYNFQVRQWIDEVSR